MNLVIVGTGIAGASAAYFASQKGVQVTLIDAGRERASDVPIALVNPVRGTAGKVVEGGFAATRFTFELIEKLILLGHPIGFGRGLTRPVPDAATVAQWTSRMPAGESWHWRTVDPCLNLSGQWHQSLYLPEAGWIETRSFLDALLKESRADLIEGQVTKVVGTNEVLLDDGRRIGADMLLWCGGALGAATVSKEAQNFRPGSVLILDRPLSHEALSYGIYAAPFGERGVVGSTSEPPAPHYGFTDNPEAIRRLERRVASMWRSVPATLETFRAVRFERTVSSASVATLDGFGSRGYLLAPSAASAWAERTFA